MMKKFLFFAVLACTVTAGLTLTSCSDDDHAEKPLTIAKYDVHVSQDLLDLANVFISYKDNNNENKIEAITTPHWTKTVTSNVYPVQLGVKYNFFLKGSQKLKNYYNIKFSVSLEGRVEKNGEFSNARDVLSYDLLYADKVDEEIDSKSGQSFGFVVYENGSLTSNDNLNYNF